MSLAPTDEPGAAGLPSLSTVAMLATVFTGGLFITVGVASQLVNIAFGMWFSEVFVFLAVPYLCLRISGYDALRTAGLSRPWVAGALYGFAVGAVNFFAIVVPLQFLSQSVAPKWLVEKFDVSGIFKWQTPLELVAVVGGVCVAAPLCEEFFFRGVMQQGMAKVVPPVRAVVITAVVFSFFHLDPVGFLARWELGICFGLLMLRSASIWPGVFAHLANNSISVGLYFLSGDAADDEQLKGWVPLAMLAVGAPLLFALIRLGSAWPRALTPPFKAADTARPARPARLLLVWVGSGALAFATLFAVDFTGVRLNLVDAFNPLREPKKADSREAKRQWEALYVLRNEVRHGDAELREYEAARKAAIADRDTTKPKPTEF